MNEDRAREVVEHLQAAALELIAAARAVLDLAEEVVKDPSEVVVLASALASHVPGPGAGPPRARGGPVADGDGATARVQRIRVS